MVVLSSAACHTINGAVSSVKIKLSGQLVVSRSSPGLSPPPVLGYLLRYSALLSVLSCIALSTPQAAALGGCQPRLACRREEEWWSATSRPTYSTPRLKLISMSSFSRRGIWTSQSMYHGNAAYHTSMKTLMHPAVREM